MTRTEVYDSLLSLGIEDPCVLELGTGPSTRCIIGNWVALSELARDPKGVEQVLRSGLHGIELLAEEPTWDLAMAQFEGYSRRSTTDLDVLSERRWRNDVEPESRRAESERADGEAGE